MKLYMKQKVFAWRDKFSIYDEYQNPVYTVNGEIFTLGKKLHLYNATGAEVAYIHQKLMSLKYRFFIDLPGKPEAEVVKKITFLKPKYLINGYGWQVEGKFMQHDYKIMDATGNIIASIHKQWVAWGDTYEIEIADQVDHDLVVAVILVIDAVMASEAATAAAT